MQNGKAALEISLAAPQKLNAALSLDAAALLLGTRASETKTSVHTKHLTQEHSQRHHS